MNCSFSYKIVRNRSFTYYYYYKYSYKSLNLITLLIFLIIYKLNKCMPIEINRFYLA